MKKTILLYVLYISIGCNLFGTTEDLCTAARKGNFPVVQNLVSKGANVNGIGLLGETPLSFALENGNTDVIIFLLNNGAIVKAESYLESSLFFWAAINGNVFIIDFLTKDGHKKNIKDIHDRTPLHYAAEKGKLDVVRILVTRKIFHFDDKDTSGISPLYLAAMNHHTSVVKYLIGAGADTSDYNLFFFAIKDLDLKFIKKYIEEHIKKNKFNINSPKDLFTLSTSLHEAASLVIADDRFFRQKEIIKTLIYNGASIYCKNWRDLTPLDVVLPHCGGLSDAQMQEYLNLKTEMTQWAEKYRWEEKHGSPPCIRKSFILACIKFDD